MRVRLCFILNCAATVFLAVIAAVLYARWQHPINQSGSAATHYTLISDNPHKGLPGQEFQSSATTGTASGSAQHKTLPESNRTTTPSAPPVKAASTTSTTKLVLVPKRPGSVNQHTSHHGAAEPAAAPTRVDDEIPDVVLEALGPHIEAMPPHTSVAIINCVNWHFEIILGFAQVLAMMKMNTTVYMLTQTSRSDTAMQLMKRLDKNIKIKECMEYRAKDVTPVHLAIMASAQEEIYLRTHGIFVFRATKPKVALSIHHNTASYRRGLMAHVFSLHPRMYMMALAPVPLDIMTKVVRERYRQHPGYFNWILPIYHYVPKHPCTAKMQRCQYQFTVQGRLEESRRNYTRLFQELRSDNLDPRLHVKLVGNPVPENPLAIPPELEDVISVHPGLPFQEYYEAIHHSAGLLPLFSTDNYIAGSKISSTVITSLICNVPLVATQALIDAYPFFTKDSCHLMKPGQTEVEAMNSVVQSTPSEHAATRAALEEVRKAVVLRTIKVLNDVMKMQVFSVPLK